MIRLWLAVAGLGGLASVAAGALAAHLTAEPRAAELLRTGAIYGMVHATALIRLSRWRRAASRGAVLPPSPDGALPPGSCCLAAACSRWLGWVTPVGGVALLLGWTALASLALRRR
jgi:uncharacterized membrane protein YgdD (TMEM256/DUF423 family)